MMKILVSILICVLTISAQAQSFEESIQKGYKFSKNEWLFGFLMIPNVKKSITTNYHATTFEITSDSTFVMGMSEAVESGTINQDSTLSIKLYDAHTGNDNTVWAESYKIIHCSDDYLILVQKGMSYNGIIENYKGFGDIWSIYSKKEIGWDKEAKKLYRKLKKWKIIQ